MAKLALFLLGPPRLERDGVPLQFDTRKNMALVAYVAVSAIREQGRQIRRDSLLALLWPELEPSRARAVLRRNLSLLRSALQGEWLVVDRHTVGTDPEADFWLDVDEFSSLVRAWKTHGHPHSQVCSDCLTGLERAAALYQGDFLEGFGLRDSVEFDDWSFFQADELRRELATALERLVRGHVTLGDPSAALPPARQWLALDPLHEPAHRQLMDLYAETGQRSAALRQFQECVRILDQELGLAPSEETRDLFEQIRTRRPASRASATSPAAGDGSVTPRRAARPRHNLPAQTTPFLGREEELAEISARLLDPGCRLLTLLGPGGIGKTRLALQLAEDLAGAVPAGFEHGVCFVPLAPLQTAEGITPAVADALGFSFHTDVEGSARATPRRQLLDYLRRKQLLLVMDNYEHLLADGTETSSGSDGVGFLTDALAAAPGVKVLATSRERLNVQGEHLYPLSGLPVPDASLPLLPDAGQVLRGYGAVELFVRGAQRARPDFEPDSDDLGHVANICRLVQGMPLAILLAAAWVEMLTPEGIEAEIEQSLDFLKTDMRDIPERQRSLRAVFDHSWRLLGERERAMFQGLSVFRGGFSREAALEVVGATLRDLLSMVNKSLLHSPSPGRYELHELLRQYGADQLDRQPDRKEATLSRHCAYYSAELERWAGELKGTRQRETLNEMDLEIENGRAAWYWAAHRGLEARLAQGASAMWLYHARRLRPEEGEAAFRMAARGLDPPDSPGKQRLLAECLTLLSSLLLDLARKQASKEVVERAKNLLTQLAGDGLDVRREMAAATFQEARIMRYYHNDPQDGLRNFAFSAKLYEEVGDGWGMARALAYQGWMTEQLGRFGEAQELCERSLAIRRELGDQHGMADAMLNLGIIYWVQGKLEEAQRLLSESLGIYRSLDDWTRTAHTLKSLGEVLVRRGLFEDGLALLESSAEIYADLGYAYGVGWLLPFQGEAKLHLGLYGQARAVARQGARHASRTRHHWSVGFAQFVAGLVALADGTDHDAHARFTESAGAFDQAQHRENKGWVLGPLALAARGLGERAKAREYTLEALHTGVDLGAFMPVIYALPAAALLLADRGDAGRAVEVHSCASRYPFVAESRWYQDVLGGPMQAVMAKLPKEMIAEARARGQALGWRDVASILLGEL